MSLSPHHTRRLRARPDLQYTPQEGAGGDRYAVKDPVSLEYFYLRRREYFLLRELSTPRTLGELRAAYQRRFPGERITHDELLAFCSAMHRCSLLMPAGPGQAAEIEERSTARRGVLASLLSPLAIRLPGVDPAPLLGPLTVVARVLLRRSTALLLAVVAVVIGLLLLQQADRLFAELARLADLTRPEYAGAALLALVVMKSWHEIGHGLAVRRFGGECHEMGILLLAFLPCLYCDASDAWSFRSRRRRAVVALAGVYFELTAALVATTLWLILAPSFWASLMLYAAVIGSAMTLVVNLNPLLRFDGYYLLADAWGVANLHAESRRALWGPLLRWVRGSGPDRIPFDAPRGLLALFAAASSAHLIAVMTLLLWALHRGLDASGFRFAGDVLVAAALFGLLVRVGTSLLGAVRAPHFTAWWRPPVRMATLLAVVGVIGWAALGVRLEQTLRSPCRLESTSAASVAAPSAGGLVRLASYGTHVDAGEPIARLDDPRQELELLNRLEREAALAARLAGLRIRAPSDASLFAEVSLVETQLAETRRQRRTLERNRERMTLRAPVAGLVTRPPPRAGEPLNDTDTQPTWVGALLDDANSGCGAEPGEVLCVVAGEQRHAVVLLRESDSGLVQPGDPVRIALDRAPHVWLLGTVEEIALASTDDRRSRPGDTTDVALEASLHPALDVDRTHRVRVQLAPLTGPAVGLVQHGAVGQARIVTGDESVGGRLLRWARQAFHFQ